MIDNLKDIERGLQRVWDTVGGDYLSGLEEEGGGSTLTKEDVVEVVLDAGYLETYNKDLDTKQFRALSYNDQKKIARKVFPFSRYGW